MARATFYLSLVLLFIASVVPSYAQKRAQAEETVLTVPAGAPLTVECELRAEQRAEWRLEGGTLPADLRPAGEAPRAAGWLVARLSAPAARPHHVGRYTCAPDRARSVRVALLPATAPVAAPPIAPPVAPAAASEPAEGTRVVQPAPPAQRVYYDVRANLSLRCDLLNDKTEPYVWSKNYTALDELPDVKARSKLEEGGAVFSIVGRTTEDDYGNYTCAVGGAVFEWEVRAHPVPRLPPNTNVVEGQTLKIQCKVTGKPYPRVMWLYSNSSDEAINGSAVGEALGGRARLQRSEQGVEDGELVLAEARREDAGRYWCAVPEGAHAVTTLRVKDMYAALWPFLGICAEVFVLCAIILVYEKRRTKPELDDSDTDNHDQKKS